LLGLSAREDSFTLRLAPGQKVLSAPVPVSQQSAYGDFEVSVKQSAGEISVSTRLVVKKSRITPAEYAGWQKFCADADRAFGQPVVVQP
jgi:hypothetical protein